MVAIHRDLTERRRLERTIGQHMALHDPLTGLGNRTQLMRALVAWLAQPAAVPVMPALLLLDLDRFEQIDDGHGQPIGDEVPVTIAHRLRRATAAGDRVAGLGGDELCVLAFSTGDGGAFCWHGAAGTEARPLSSPARPSAS